MHFAYRFKEIIESRWMCASMEVIHKQETAHKDQINKFENFTPMEKRNCMGIKIGICTNPYSFFL